MTGTLSTAFQFRVSTLHRQLIQKSSRRRPNALPPLCSVSIPLSVPFHPESDPYFNHSTAEDSMEKSEFQRKRLLRQKQVKNERETYRFIAFAASSFMAALACFATFIRFVVMKPLKAPFPWIDFTATLLLVFGGTMGMEMYARWAHKVWWHDSSAGWAWHKSHHEPRTGPFEANDIYAIANALPAFLLCYFGFIRPGILGSLCFGLGLGITLFGMAYMFVHDGLVHRRFPVGPLADLPFMKKVAAAHMIHHSDKYGGLPFGMFLGPQEIDHIPEAVKEMEKIAATLGNK